MYYIMNKDRIIAEFDYITNELGTAVPKLVSGSLPEIYGYTKLKSWLETRRNGKRRTDIARLLRNLGMTDIKSFIDISLGLTLTDTLLVKEEHSDSTWNDVNLYDNEFSEIVSQTAFMGGISDLNFKIPAPEYGSDGNLSKCWVRRTDGVYLLKGGTKGFNGAGYEPYSEFFVSQLENALGIEHIEYDLDNYHDRIVSSCKLVTSKEVIMIPSVYYFKNCSELPEYLDIADKLGAGERLRDMLVLDALTCNYDRHLNNIQFLVDSDTYEIISLAPVFDNGMGLCSHCKDETTKAFIDYGNNHVPFAYYSFDDHIP
ncbi:hypothetical protein [uncultured Ruminococcus sp.]|uniref:hypothetical protein n=1 Tax=uncultured Ruminococcus sp. TaxID=165186 RepID=UPI0025F39D04|nr:hypothetical protein [uncultured Ruminococcus sp.]